MVFACLLLSSQQYAAGLRDFYEKGIIENLSLKSADELYESQLMEQKQADALWTPKIGGQVGVARFNYNVNDDVRLNGNNGNIDSRGELNSNIEVIEGRQLLFDFSALKALKLAGKERQISKMLLQHQREQFIENLVNLYFNCLSSKESIKSSRSFKALSVYSLKLAKQDYELQLSTIEKYFQAKAQYQHAMKDELEATRQFTQSLGYLNQYAQSHFNNVRSLKPDILLHLPHPQKKQYWIDKGLQQNTQLIIDRLKLAAKKIEYQQSISKYGPTAEMIGLLYRGKNIFPAPAVLPLLGMTKNLNYRGAVLGVGFKMPFFTGSALSSKVKRIAHQVQAQMIKNKDHQQLVKLDISNLYENLSVYLQEIKETKAEVIANEEIVEIKRNKLKLQTEDYVNYLSAVTQYKQSIDDYNQARHNYIKNMVKLKKMSGTLTFDTIRDISRLLS